MHLCVALDRLSRLPGLNAGADNFHVLSILIVVNVQGVAGRLLALQDGRLLVVVVVGELNDVKVVAGRLLILQDTGLLVAVRESEVLEASEGNFADGVRGEDHLRVYL